MNRRSVLTTIGSAGFVSLSGCPFIGGPVEATAGEPRVGQSALDQTDYTHERSDQFKLEETVEVADESQEVSLTNWIVAYRKELDALETLPAQFSIVSSPTVSVAGRSVNPFRRIDEKRLLEKLASRLGHDGLENLEEVDDRNITVLDESVEFTEYKGETEEGVDVTVHLGNLTHDGDFLMLLGVHPEEVDESDTVATLAGGTEHPVD